uniref:RNA-directed DNA polymerase n=1 Tax=Strongyloides papillosus TaxID=174720 RepID=A0A0N5BSS4_STREA
MSVSQNLETLMTNHNMEVPPEYGIQGGIHKSTLLKNCTEMCRLVEGSGSATGKVVLKHLLALAKDYADLKGSQNGPNDSRLSETLEQLINLSLMKNTENFEETFSEGNIRGFIQRFESSITSDREKIFPSKLKGVAKLAYYAVPESKRESWNELKETIITKLDPPEGRLTSTQIKQKLRQMEPQEKEVGLKFLLRVEAAMEKYKELYDWDPSTGEIFELLHEIFNKTMAGIPKGKEARELDGSVEKIKKWFLERTRNSYCKKKVFRKEGKPFKPTFKKESKKINTIKKKDSEENSEVEINAYCLTTDCKFINKKNKIGIKPIIKININNLPASCLLDSGANVSLINSSFVCKSKLQIESLDTIKIRDASNNSMNILGTNIITKSPKIYDKFMSLMKPEVNKLDVDIELDKILHENEVAFSKNDNDISETNFFKHKIIVKDHPPIREKKRPTPLALQKLVKKKLDEMLKNKIIRPSISPWSAPLQIVAKGSDDVRLCVDYRKLNRIIKLDAYSLPNIQLLFQSLHDRAVFTNLDLTKGYWQIGLTECSKQYTAFSCDYGLFEFNKLPFGLATSPAEFERMMELVFRDLIQRKVVFVYLDDILIATKTVHEHLEILDLVLKRVIKYKLKINKGKSNFCKSSIPFLGFDISAEGVKIDKVKQEKILNSIKSCYVTILSRIYKLFSKCLNAFNKIKEILLKGEALAQPDIESAINGSNPFIIFIDASYRCIGACLMQRYEKHLRPIMFFSRALQGAEKNYHISDLEALSLVSALKRFKNIIYHTKVKIYTDHAPLVSFFTKTNLANRLLRWALLIQEYNIEIIHIKGSSNAIADYLSRPGWKDSQEPKLEEFKDNL